MFVQFNGVSVQLAAFKYRKIHPLKNLIHAEVYQFSN